MPVCSFVSLNFVSPACNTWFKKKKAKNFFKIIIRPWVLAERTTVGTKGVLGKTSHKVGHRELKVVWGSNLG